MVLRLSVVAMVDLLVLVNWDRAWLAFVPAAVDLLLV